MKQTELTAEHLGAALGAMTTALANLTAALAILTNMASNQQQNQQAQQTEPQQHPEEGFGRHSGFADAQTAEFRLDAQLTAPPAPLPTRLRRS